MIEEPAHGGEVDMAADAYGIPRDRWLDLSTGINTRPYPIPELARDYWHRLPDQSLTLWLKETAATYYGVPEKADVVPAPGSQALIRWLPRLIPPTRVAVIAPTYAEHAPSWSMASHEVIERPALDDLDESIRVAIVVNPNNPDGRQIQPDRLLRVAARRLVVVDEAFADVTPEISVAAHAGHPGLIILRSTGKFFGLAGMRLGFALVSPTWGEHLTKTLGPWAYSAPAAAIGAVAMSDTDWIRSTRLRLTSAAGRLDGLLVRAGLTVVGGTTLFRLAASPGADTLFDHLARAAILVRRFPRHPNWLRFGVPMDPAAFDRLQRALAAWRPPAAARTASATTPASPATAGQPAEASDNRDLSLTRNEES